jgi:hypothetical protein
MASRLLAVMAMQAHLHRATVGETWTWLDPPVMPGSSVLEPCTKMTSRQRNAEVPVQRQSVMATQANLKSGNRLVNFGKSKTHR